MRHNDKVKKLSRTTEHRNAMLNNLVTSLFERNVVITTTAKAKEARKLAEKMITIAKKEDSVHTRREISKRIRSNEIIKRLFEDIAPLYKARNGGYTRVISVGIRRGDGASTSILELVEKPASKDKEKTEKKAEKKAEKKTEKKAEKKTEKPAEKKTEKKPDKKKEKK
ncbi:TPA: 50S ribosomal protein L17 [candidate division WOR-3 bacterium]|jgi:large subunit ribosomal protein L17|uniref:Large ribosomal subunit protein bL17 n=1 Tax=candidate division WOR-3 bacterium TaxID=2052148 RepID=A0A350H8V0_UNCW3|nr:50S ribosomal protein L17 [candidate division WOR-3 bacterium]